MLKVGVVGVGGISGAHIPVWEAMENAELTAICDIRTERMEKYEGKRKYTDFDEMLNNEEFDIIDICLPTYLHADFAVKAMERGINVICEKPISLKEEDVERVYSTAEKNNVKFMVAQVLRFWPEYELLKEIYETKKYGKLLSGTMTRLGCYPRWSWDGWMMDEREAVLYRLIFTFTILTLWFTLSVCRRFLTNTAQSVPIRTLFPSATTSENFQSIPKHPGIHPAIRSQQNSASSLKMQLLLTRTEK